MATAEEHVAWVYDHLLTRAQAEHVALVGYGHGARLCKEVLLRSLTVRACAHWGIGCCSTGA